MSNTAKGVIHGVVSLILFGVPLVLGISGGWQDLTIGTILNGIYHWAIARNG